MINTFKINKDSYGTSYTIKGCFDFNQNIDIDDLYSEINKEISLLLKRPIAPEPKESTPARTQTPDVKPDLQLRAEPFNLISNNDFLESLVGKYVKLRKEVFQILSFIPSEDTEAVIMKVREFNKPENIYHVGFNDCVNVYNDIKCTDYFHNALEYRKGQL